MRPAKSLLARVEAGTFRPGRHGHLLSTGTLPRIVASTNIWQSARACDFTAASSIMSVDAMWTTKHSASGR